jgi:seryl-tRNA synthetase
MLDIKFIRENKDLVSAGASKKHINFDVNKLIAIDDTRKLLLAEVEQKRARQNEFNGKIATAKEGERVTFISEMQNLKEELFVLEEKLKDVMKEWQTLMVEVPNIPDVTVPDGKSDKENRELRTWGEMPKFDFEPKDHIALMESLDMADFERGAKVSGFRGYFLKNDGALLSFALYQFVLDNLVKKGFTPMIVPSLVKRPTLLGTGYLPQGEEDLYKTQDGEYLAGTGEAATMAYYMDEVIDPKNFPLKMLAFSPCFRREAGSHGKDVKGLYRVHEFLKFEQVVLCEANHASSVALHEEITMNAEEMLQALNLPYRVVVNCGGDLGLGQVKKYDIEVWRAGQKAYGETHSASYFHDFQTRRLNIRYKDQADGKLKFAHSLNNTALAFPRILISIVENNQNADGSINVPEVLQKYLGKSIIRNV